MIFHRRSQKYDYALVVDWRFHKRGKWVSVFAPFIVRAIVREFNPVIITSQRDYERYKETVRYVVAMEPGWGAPKLRYDTRLSQRICVFASDPHNKAHWFEDYVHENKIDFVLSQYYHPFLYHFPDFPPDKLVHFPWAVPDNLLSHQQIAVRTSDVAIFGARDSNAYDIRNWCRHQDGIINYKNSGVENKAMDDDQYLHWLAQFDAVVAAGSSDPKYDLVTPKYFEICAAGSLLIGQHCRDLQRLGFNDDNMLVFTKQNFNQIIQSYKRRPADYIHIRKKGRQLIEQKHLISHRIQLLKTLFAQL